MCRKHILSRSKGWIAVYIIFPLIPFFLDGLIRFIAGGNRIHMNTFNSSTLSLSVSFISLLLSQNILKMDRPLENQDDQEDRKYYVALFSIYTILFTSIFSVLVLCNALIEFKKMSDNSILNIFSIIAFLLSILPIYHSIRAHQMFKLKVDE
jgi:hypothetical protein